MQTIIVRPFVIASDLKAVVKLYKACFAEPPWFESFDSEDLTREFQDLITWPECVFLVADEGNSIVGATIGFELRRVPDIASLVDPSAQPQFYLSELFVDANKRRQGIAEALMKERFKIARLLGYQEGVVRTSVNQPIIRDIYERLNFRPAAMQHVESMKRVDGVERRTTDARVILRGVMPA